MSSNVSDLVHFNLRSLADVDLGSITTGQGLSWNGTKFVATALSSGSSYVLPAATSLTLGGVRVGSGLTIDGTGLLNVLPVASTYVLPTASTTTLGGIRVGAGLSMTSGVLSVDGGTGDYVLPTATASTLGGIKVGTGLTITNGVLSADSSGSYAPLNHTHAYLPLTGGTVTGKVTINNVNADFTVSSHLAQLEIASINALGAAAMSFNITGSTYRSRFGINTAGKFEWGGGSMAAARATLDSSGNFVAAGNVSAYSDERVKRDIETITNALDIVKSIRGVRYTRIDSGETGLGVIAQEVMKRVPEVVIINDDGMMSVAYGNLVGLLIEAIKEQQIQIDKLSARLGA